MSSAIEDILFLLDEVSAEILVGPTETIAPNEEVFGRISDEAKVFYKAALAQHREVKGLKEAGDLLADLSEGSGLKNPDLEMIDLTLSIATLRLNVCLNLLFAQVFDEYPEARYCGLVALRKGWVLVGKINITERSEKGIMFELSTSTNPEFQYAAKA